MERERSSALTEAGMNNEPIAFQCPACREESYYQHQDFPPDCCEHCRGKYPESLLKALVDVPFDYALRLRTGEVILFSGAEIHGQWVHLKTREDWLTPGNAPRAYTAFRFERGLDVRLADIVWCADAPDGS